MRIELTNLGKRYNRHWIFRQLTHTLESGSCTAITGPNGSGKSTLLQVIGGALEKSEGNIHFINGGQEIPAEYQFREVAFCTPYIQLPEELSLIEFLDFHGRFKPWMNGFGHKKLIDLMGLHHARHKWIRDFSSGMKQRVKLIQAMLTSASVVLLDEPTSNLDEAGIATYFDWLHQFTAGKTVLIASNDSREIASCSSAIHIPDFSPAKA